MTWFIDRDTPEPLKIFLRSRGQASTHGNEVDWGELQNGKLVDRLYSEGFRVILTTRFLDVFG